MTFQPANKSELQTAVNLWINDNASALLQYEDIYTWDTSLITDMSSLFHGKNTFNDDISSWNTSIVTNMSEMFRGASTFNKDISSWNVSSVTNMQNMFRVANGFNQDISSWDVSNVTNFNAMFSKTNGFNNGGAALTWNVSSGSNFREMFKEATNFNQSISDWDISSTNNLDHMFQSATNFDQDISTKQITAQNSITGQAYTAWDVSNVLQFPALFQDAVAFNQNLSSWDVSNVTAMLQVFRGATSYNNGGQPLNWTTSNLTDMYEMFRGAAAFNQNIRSWNTLSKPVNNYTSMFYDATAMIATYGPAGQNLAVFGTVTNNYTPTSDFFNIYLPVLTISGDNPLSIIVSSAQSYLDPGATAVTENGTDISNDVGVSGDPVNINIIGTYSVIYTVTLNGISVSATRTVNVTSPPPPPICFPKGTPVVTNQGEVAIEKLNPDKHTIRGKEIVAITQSRPLQKHIVCFEKNSLSKNVPSQQTLCSMEHKVFYKGDMIKARNIVDLCENVTFVPYNGETLFNVLLKKHDKMMINNLICETLHPENIAAKISQMKNGQKKNKAIQELSQIIKENNIPEYQKLYASL